MMKTTMMMKRMMRLLLRVDSAVVPDAADGVMLLASVPGMRRPPA